MRKLYLLACLFSLSTFTLSAQSMEQGNIMFDVGGGLGIYGTTFEYNDSGTQTSTEDGAAPVYLDLNGRYGLSERFAVGLNMDFGRYLRDEEDELDNPGTFRYTKVAASLRFLLLNKDVFQFFTDLNLGYAATSFSGDDFFERASGPIFQLNGGFNVYFGSRSPVGFYMAAGYSTYSQNGKLENSDDKFKWRFKGATVQMGLTFLL